MDTQRLILFFIFSFSLLLLWDAWQKEQQPKSAPAPATQSTPGVPTPAKPLAAVPAPASPASGAPGASTAGAVPGTQVASTPSDKLQVSTDLLAVEIDTLGATLSRLELRKHKDAKDSGKNFMLLGPDHAYSAQSGLIGEGMPNHRTVWRAVPGERTLAPGAEMLQVRFAADGPQGVAVEKVYRFHRNSYLVDVAFELKNASANAIAAYAYYQIVRDDKAPAHESRMMYVYTGPVYYTAERAFHKLDTSDIEKGKADLPKEATDGWIGMMQHYFVSAWLPADKAPREYYARKLPDGLYAAGVIVATPQAAAGETAKVSVRLFSGPQEQSRLKKAAPGLDLVVDYGWLAIIAWPLFAVLEFFHQWSGNWGVAIILLTILIKLVFFPLSAASYKSMAKMKLVTPRLTKIREMYGNDRARMNQAMMELYKTEKINPLGGCFPILVQIPVFIALYWVLLAAIELRHAPFILWIHDLSAQDPYYVLPVLMAASMVFQTRMNPVPPDPVQAKIMQFMPYVFSVFFFFFPAGLVLYWLVNNLLSIAQQWQIQRLFDRDKTAHAKR
ncbi:MAG: membrane protein insertase YidC [Betaproteobacteria bacterium]|nr:membrane protein insertase YidC [Betaproteobacteria bacterium]MDH4322941.1 membrane protein insertase YidC [Betaproteobacteria bacterium]MDH5576955.1 membrane protein insertase YidC [Betaproteobacteria bacterium]